VWDDLADWYLEASKGEPNVALLHRILSDVLVLAHPYAPFLTETIWQTLGWQKDSLLATAEWPKIIHADEKQARVFEEIKAIVGETRYIIKALHAADVTMYYTDVPFLTANAGLISRMARLKGVVEVRDGDGIYLTSTPHRCWLDIDAATAQHYAVELETKIEVAKKSIGQLEGRLSNESYIKQAPKHLVDETRDQLKNQKTQLEELEQVISRF
jgi:valyl-tRNA synthetase